jgi:hypothetical protein
MEQSKGKLTHLEFTKYDTIIVWKVNLMNKCQNQSIVSYKAILALEVRISIGLTHGLLKYLNFGFLFMSHVHYFPSS